MENGSKLLPTPRVTEVNNSNSQTRYLPFSSSAYNNSLVVCSSLDVTLRKKWYKKELTIAWRKELKQVILSSSPPLTNQIQLRLCKVYRKFMKKYYNLIWYYNYLQFPRPIPICKSEPLSIQLFG